MKTSSKNLGNSYERDFSYQLSEWLTGEKNADVCWRDVGSGARHTSRKKQGLETSRKADIVCTDLKYQRFFDKFYIDTKTYKNFNFLIINQANIKSNDIFQQWVKTINDCPKGMIPLMPCKIRDRKTPEFVFIPIGVYLTCVNFISYNIKYNEKEYRFYLVLLDDFFKYNSWEHFLMRNKNIV